MIVAIQDANILIDLHNTGLLEAYFRLGLETYTTDLVLKEVEQDLCPFVQSGQLKIETLDDLEPLLAFKDKQPRSLSMQDCSVLRLAMEKKAILLTGDGRLRFHAQAQNLEVHGILWLLENMLENEILGYKEACIRLEQLMQTNPRLPMEACQQRLKKWGAAQVLVAKRQPRK